MPQKPMKPPPPLESSLVSPGAKFTNPCLDMDTLKHVSSVGSGGKRHPPKSTQNKRVHVNRFTWTISRAKFRKVHANTVCLGNSGFWVEVWASIASLISYTWSARAYLASLMDWRDQSDLSALKHKSPISWFWQGIATKELYVRKGLIIDIIRIGDMHR